MSICCVLEYEFTVQFNSEGKEVPLHVHPSKLTRLYVVVKSSTIFLHHTNIPLTFSYTIVPTRLLSQALGSQLSETFIPPFTSSVACGSVLLSHTLRVLLLVFSMK